MNKISLRDPLEEDEEARRARAALRFGLKTDSLSSDEISIALHLSPTSSWSRGDLKHSKSGKSYTAASTVWKIGTFHLLSNPRLEAHVDYLLEILEPRVELLNILRPRLDHISLWITVFPTDYSTLVWIPGPKLARLAALVDEVSLVQDISDVE